MEKEAQNGEITSVSIHLDDDSDRELWRGAIQKYSATVVVGCQRLTLSLFAHNGAGWSKKPSKMVIPAGEDAGGCVSLLKGPTYVKYRHIYEGSVAEWLARQTRDLVVAGSIPNQAML